MKDLASAFLSLCDTVTATVIAIVSIINIISLCLEENGAIVAVAVVLQ